MSDHAPAVAHEHPTPKTYAKIAVVLCAITVVEVWVFYVENLRSLLVPILVVLSAVKFSLVVMFYMHLKFDHPVFKRLLTVGVGLGFSVFLALLALFTFSHPIVIP